MAHDFSTKRKRVDTPPRARAHGQPSSAVHALSLGAAAIAFLAVLSAQADAEGLLKTDSRAPFVHRHALYDEEGEVISPEDEPALPYSPAKTCGKCHPYAEISSGWHFSAFDADAPTGRPGEPWILVDKATGTQLPLSARGWAGTFKPGDVGVTPWRFVQMFGRHHPGGGPGERFAEKPIDPKARWKISGQSRIDCMVCHSAAPSYDACERAHQIERQNFKWLPVAASGLGIVRGDARKIPDDFDPLLPPSPDMGGQAFPSVSYDEARFDANDRVLFNIGRTPSADQCYFCHTTREVGTESWEIDRDVHLAAGLTCVDCHRNGIDHRIVRGYEGEAAGQATLTCRGCHLGDGTAKGGRFGAPRPRHRGLLAFHLERLTCTACHAGPRPSKSPRRIQTARAHGLGLPSMHRRDDALPVIVSPVLAKQADGKIGPHRMMWPAFWGRMKGDGVSPIAPEHVMRKAAKALGRMKASKAEAWKPMSAEQIAAALDALAQADGENGEPVYVCAGKVYRRAADGKLSSSEHPAARAYAWPLGHDVRPAAQSLGAGGCTDCHSADSGFFFGRVSAEPALLGQPAEANVMHELMGQDPSLASAWVRFVRYRTAFIWISLISCVVLVLTLIRYGFVGLFHLGRRAH